MTKSGIKGDLLSSENRQQIDLFFNQFLPKGKKKVIRERIEGEIVGVCTKDIEQTSARSGGLTQDTTVFISEDYENELSEQNLFVLKELTRGNGQLPLDKSWLTTAGFNAEYIRQLLPFKHLYLVNPSLFRTPQDLVILNHEPERQFIFRLVEESKHVSSWVKSPDREFYSLDYEYWKGGKDRVRRSFNPDFLIRVVVRDCLSRLAPESPAIGRLRQLEDKGIDDLILVVEIKSDDDQSEETRAKAQFAQDHFKALNQRLREVNPVDLPEPFRGSVNHQYIFYLLQPNRYPWWFSRLRDGIFIFDLAMPGETETDNIDGTD
jgi:type III restriction enzyme